MAAPAGASGRGSEAFGDDPGRPEGISRTEALVAIFVIALAGLVLEVAYTRVISYKLWYYYTYLVIGLALLGIGSGATAVVLSPRLRRAPARTVLRLSSIWGAASILVGYLVVARIPIDTLAIWDLGTGRSMRSLAVLLVICLALFATFISVGIMVAVLLGRAGDDIGRLYFSDLLGAGIACLVVVYLISWMGPPATIVLAALLLAGTGLAFTDARPPAARLAAGALVALTAVLVVVNGVLPDIRPEDSKVQPPDAGFEASGWGPVFRVDVGPVPGREDMKWLIHDATYGSAIHAFDGDPESLTRFDTDPRSWPFELLGRPPADQLIIGSAGGNEILASLYHGSEQIDAVELNPVTVDLVTDTYREFTGDLTSFPQVSLSQGDGRSFLARSDKDYDLVWYVAPDSYAANNAASSGAFVLSESYLYTADMIEETLRHLTDDGVSVAQFGEVSFDDRPNRTARYLMTAREALARLGVEDPSRHLLVATADDPLSGGLSTIVVKREPFTDEEVRRFVEAVPSTDRGELVYAPGVDASDSIVARIPVADEPELERIQDEYPFEIDAITDDAPFFWHFTPFTDVARDLFSPINEVDREIAVGERVLLLLLAIATLFAVVFLLLPFVVIRKEWRALPAKGPSAFYFAALGLGFMFYEITMIQRLTEYLGFPTYSLTVTLASILVFTGLGALLSNRFAAAPVRVLPGVLGVLALLTVFYRFALPGLTEATLNTPFAVRVVISFLVLAPLGLCLGMFMPLGLRSVARLNPVHPDEYVAWGWAINGVFSVIGSVLTTILSMSFGFRNVQLLAFGVYLLAGLALWRLRSHEPPAVVDAGRPAESGPSPEAVPVGAG
jgi:hypothetical protein